MKLNMKLSISRPSSGGINIRIKDDLSHIEFVDASISLEEFAEAVTGLSSRNMVVEVRGLEFVGKKNVTEKRSVMCPIDTYDKNVLKAWLCDNVKEDGWVVNTYLGGQSSVGRNKEGELLLNYSVSKFIEPQGDTQ